MSHHLNTNLQTDVATHLSANLAHIKGSKRKDFGSKGSFLTFMRPSPYSKSSGQTFIGFVVLLPTAIFLEYIPNMHQMDLTTFSLSRLLKLKDILQDIHRAGVLHDDTDPRNMMVCPGSSEDEDRVLWIDFDRAQLYPETDLSPYQERCLKSENRLVEQFVQFLVCCCNAQTDIC
ncbi:hypothetical protein BJX99DRAFT_233198 [Aspergillus californicus]